MIKLIARRLLSAIPLLLVVSFAVFLLVDLAPGDPAYRLAGENPSPEQVEQVRRALRLDDPLPLRYGRWLADLAQGSLGQSMSTSEPVSELVARRLPVTLSLTALALVFSIVVGLGAGIVAALFPRRWPDHIVIALGSAGIAVPSFWLGLLLVIFFAVENDWFPALGYAPLSDGFWLWLYHLTLPAITLAVLPTAEMALQVRAAVLEVLNRDYILAARARGLAPASIILKHALKNAAIPVVTVLGFRASQLLGGSVIVESVFVLNGIGTLAIISALSSDMPVMLALTVVTTLAVVVINLCVDSSYAYFNPKVRSA
jgi:peptide/nickel transport system permease protein